MNHSKLFTILLIHILLSGYLLQAQQKEFLNANLINAGINASGDLFTDYDIQNPLFEVPKGSGKNAIYAANLWIGGYDDMGNLRVAAQTYRQSNSVDYWAGPIAKSYDSAYDLKYNRVWKIEEQMIKNHILNYKNTGYEMPEVIKNWPANGNLNNLEAPDIAPYQDVNMNGKYDPQNGDYPKIFGDQAIYFIVNDIRSNHTETNSLPLGIEIHGMAFSFETSSSSSLDQTIFLNYKIINRSKNNYNNVFLGFWTDFDLGFSYDDFVGSDSSRSMFFAYNADNLDEGVNGYGAKPPVLGIRSLNNKMTGFMSYYNDFSLSGNPTESIHFYNYLVGKYKNGRYFDSFSKFMYPETFLFDKKISSSDRRGIGTYGPFNLVSGKSECFDFAITYARDPNKDHLSNLEILKYLSGEVKKYYNNSLLGCNCTTIGNNEKLNKSEIKVYPMPAKDRIFIEMPDIKNDNLTFELISSNGKSNSAEIINSSNTLYEINTKNIDTGVYFLMITNNETILVKQIVIIPWLKIRQSKKLTN